MYTSRRRPVPYRVGVRVPDAIEPELGWRAWDVVELDGSLRLCSLAFWTIWQPGAGARATCRRSLFNPGRAPVGHAAPDLSCSCGIYAARSARQVLAYARRFRPRSDTVQRVIGTVSLWGTVVECEGGWRAERAYPSTLYVPSFRRRRRLGRRFAPRLPIEEIALGLADYGVPIEIVDCTSDRELAATVEPRRPPR
jgi:hypothetical protein